jgi:hypothetical protein
MKPSAKLAYLTAACALLVTTFAIIGPRTVHAVVATLVRDVDNAGRHPFVASCSGTTSGENTTCNISVPAGEEVVIQTEVLSAFADPANKLLLTTVGTSVGANTIYAYGNALDDGRYQPTQSELESTFTYTLYADPGSTITCSGNTKNANPTIGLEFNCQVSGYYVTLP